MYFKPESVAFIEWNKKCAEDPQGHNSRLTSLYTAKTMTPEIRSKPNCRPIA